jgi:2-oxoglutarate ferredoxin oxidoreductase subunit beta
LKVKREKVTIVSGIGCHGKIVNYLNVNGFHGIHGRVLPIATGIKLTNPDLTVIGFAGDGDQYDEGWQHFSHAIRKNININLIVHNNQIFSLTTGQTTPTSMIGFKTKSTPFGSFVSPLNPIAHALVSYGTFVARGFAGDPKHLKKIIIEAITHRGFSYIDVLQPCVSFNYLNTFQWFKKRVYKLEKKHDFTNRKKALEKSFEWGNKIPIGIFYKEEKPTYRDNLPHIHKGSLTKRSLKDIDINPLLEKMK